MQDQPSLGFMGILSEMGATRCFQGRKLQGFIYSFKRILCASEHRLMGERGVKMEAERSGRRVWESRRKLRPPALGLGH